MSGEQGQQGSEVATATVRPVTDEQRWGEPIPPEREAELDAVLRAWEQLSPSEQAARRGPFGSAGEQSAEPMHLTGADVFYLAARALAGGLAAEALALVEAQVRLRDEAGRHTLDLSTLHLERADLRGAQLAGADLRRVHLEQASLGSAQLAGANLRGA